MWCLAVTNIISRPRKTKISKPKRRFRLDSIFGIFIMAEEKRRHVLAADFKHALTNLEFLHSHSASTLDEFANWLLLTYFDYVEYSLLKDAILLLPEIDQTEKPVPINKLLESALALVIGQNKTWKAILGWTAAKLADAADVSQLDARLIATVNNLPQAEKQKLIRMVRYGQDFSSIRRHGVKRV